MTCYGATIPVTHQVCSRTFIKISPNSMRPLSGYKNIKRKTKHFVA